MDSVGTGFRFAQTDVLSSQYSIKEASDIVYEVRLENEEESEE